jgi:hypothetical protein
MKLLSLLPLCIVYTAASLAQTSPQSTPDNPSHSMQQDSQPASLASSMNKGEQQITGCIRSENDKYQLESKPRKKIWLSGPMDFAPHSGHTVTVSGSFLNDSNNNATAPANGGTEPKAATREGSNFQVTKLEMVSGTCTLKNTKNKKSPPAQP